MHKTHRLSRLASIGLGAVLLVLTAFAIYAAAITFDVISQTSDSVHITDLYQQAQYLISKQNALEWQYQAQPKASACQKEEQPHKEGLADDDHEVEHYARSWILGLFRIIPERNSTTIDHGHMIHNDQTGQRNTQVIEKK